MNIEATIQTRLKALNVPGDHAKLAHDCYTYLALLEKWNNAYNLTAVHGMDDMIERHILDSFAIHAWIKGKYVIDVGTGAGLPGIPLALCYPDKHVVLLDSNGKKTRFLLEAQRLLQIPNIEVVQTRVEHYHPDHLFDTIVSRAFSDLQSMLKMTRHLLHPEGQWVAMKGPNVNLELQNLTHPYRLEAYHVPGMSSERFCVVLEN